MRLRDIIFSIYDVKRATRAAEIGLPYFGSGKLTIAVFVDHWLPEDQLVWYPQPPHLTDVGSWDACWVGHSKAWETQMHYFIAQAYRPEGL